MPIIIETPAPPTRERLVLVSPSSVSNPIETLNGEVFTVRTTEARDATAADLERAGYVTGEMLAEQVRIVLAASKDAISRAEKAERDDAIRLHEERRDEEARLCERMERELDAERREGRDREHTLRARAMRAEEELAEYRSTAAAVSAEMSDLTLELCTHRERADAAERERDSLRAELAALRAPAEGEPSDNDLRDVWDAGETLSDSRRALWRAGVAHERTRVSAFLLREAADYAKLRAEVERLRTFCGEARDMLRDMPWRGGGDLVYRLDRAALGEP